MRLYNAVKFVAKTTSFRKGLTLLSPGSGPAFVEAYLSKFMDFKCTVIDLPDGAKSLKEYYD